jgi:hypothetical protein
LVNPVALVGWPLTNPFEMAEGQLPISQDLLKIMERKMVAIEGRYAYLNQVLAQVVRLSYLCLADCFERKLQRFFSVSSMLNLVASIQIWMIILRGFYETNQGMKDFYAVFPSLELSIN